MAGARANDAGAFFLLAVHALLLLYGIRCHFATRNEVAHVPAGLAVWKTGTFTLYRVNPPLPRMLAVLPLFPFVLIAASKPACYLQAAHWKRGLLVLALLLWSIGSSLHVYPHSLSYFNELAGGPDNGHRHLLDSNIDWGQDLLFLKEWVDSHPEAASLGLAYHNYIDYRVCGAEYAAVPRDPPTDVPSGEVANARFGPHPGYFAVDLHSLTKGGGYAYFQHFQPIAKAGYSIFIYHLTPEQAEHARHEMELPPLSRALAP